MHSATLPLCSPTHSIITRNPYTKSLFTLHPISLARKSYNNNSHSIICKAHTGTSPITDFDLYDLLGVDSSSDSAQIKLAYRKLQKQCHPDIAGPPGHDMAIILNEAYAILSDPNLRFAYDKEQSKFEALKGYTGKPLYSVWFGSESEERAVFVDEVKCVGCLKCALLAEKTFAIESLYGRARVVAQWADSEEKIQGAIDACPVDCISIVERSKLAALEFLMSKQPRGNVRIGASNTAGVGVSNIFVDVEKFQARFQDAKDKTSSKNSNESNFQREARMLAIQTIRAISNWLYWHTPIAGEEYPSRSPQKLLRIPQKTHEPNINKLQDAVSARRQGVTSSKKQTCNDEYWVPSKLLPEEKREKRDDSHPIIPSTTPIEEMRKPNRANVIIRKKTKESEFFARGVPIAATTIAAVIVRLQIGGVASGGIEEHIGGSLLVDIVNSSWLQVILAGTTWYLIGMAVVELVESLGGGMYKK